MPKKTDTQDRWSRHHYAFAHGALLQLALKMKTCVFSYLTGGTQEEREARFNALLKDTDDLVQDGTGRKYNAADFKITRHSFGDAPCLVVEMPAPRETTEAYFVAIVSRVSEIDVLSDDDAAKIRGGPGLRQELNLNYYTLEVSAGYVPGPKSLFCEWAANGRHINHGKSPEPTFEKFVSFLEDFVVKRAVAEGRDPESMRDSI